MPTTVWLIEQPYFFCYLLSNVPVLNLALQTWTFSVILIRQQKTQNPEAIESVVLLDGQLGSMASFDRWLALAEKQGNWSAVQNRIIR